MATWREWRAWRREFKSLGIRQVKEREARSIWHEEKQQAARWWLREQELLPYVITALATLIVASLPGSNSWRWRGPQPRPLLVTRLEASSRLRGSVPMIRKATTTTGSLPLSKNLWRMLLKRVFASRRKLASFLASTRYQSGHLAEFCRKCNLCSIGTAVN